MTIPGKVQYGRKIVARLANIEIDNLRMSFATREEATKQEQDSTLKIWNLKESTYQQISKNKQIGTYSIASIYAGYAEETGIHEVVSGRMAWVTRDAKQGSIITIITLGDRVYGFGRNWIKESFEGDVSVELMIRKIADTMDLGLVNSHLIPKDLTRKNVVLDNFSPNAMRDLLDSLRSDVPDLYYYQTGKSLVLAKGSDPRSDIGTIVKTPQTGLIGVPKEEEDERLTVEMLLDTRAKLKGKIKFSGSKYIKEEVDYTIDVVAHEGDNWTGRFVTKLECIPPGYVPLSSSGRIPRSAFGLSGADRFEGDSGRGGTSIPGI